MAVCNPSGMASELFHGIQLPLYTLSGKSPKTLKLIVKSGESGVEIF